jgi:hypothetical protein
MSALTYYDAGRSALIQAVKIDEVKSVLNKAEAMRHYARIAGDYELESMASRLKVRAQRRIGELSKQLEKAEAHGGKVCLPSSGKSKAATLKEAGVSTSQAHRYEKLADIPEEEFEEWIEAKERKGKIIKAPEVVAAITSKKREQKAAEILKAAPPELPQSLYVGDFREYAKQIPDESIELIFTDPPYDRESIPLFADLAQIAARVLRPGGSLIAYCGQIQLPHVLSGMAEHLRYWWVNACVHSGKHNQMDKYGIKNGWKPMVWFVKGTRGDVQTFVEDTVTGAEEKSHHAWQQAESEAAYYIERLCSPSGIVWEPFGGGGTTLAACESLGRKWIACEINPASAARIADRLRERKAA